ncbi:hypothetical protein TWF191_005958 [Orbilia oligospora]|uniref:Uncharacterized protein n=1 Tax=Orbilia oligospora TaxID=2813651 RepID=A0A7C8QWW6_ORBOL|nr:hypothetical protein TWF191_005958 [Orbilia oligospora]
MTIIPILSNELPRPQTLTVPESGYVWSGLPLNIDHRPSTGYWTCGADPNLNGAKTARCRGPYVSVSCISVLVGFAGADANADSKTVRIIVD